MKPSIAVLPLSNMSGDHAKEDFADGMFGEIIPSSAVGTCFRPPTSRVGPPAR